MSLESRFGIYESRKAAIATLMQLPFGSQKERIDCYLSANKALRTLQICLKALFPGEIPTFARKVCATKVLHASGTSGYIRRTLQVVHACTFNASRVNREANNPPVAYSYRVLEILEPGICVCELFLVWGTCEDLDSLYDLLHSWICRCRCHCQDAAGF